MTVIITKDDFSNVSRASQLTQRTNQFNMTTIRRSESQIKELMSSPQHSVYTLRLLDRFGDNGIVGLAIVEHKGKEAVLETFLMSCRVIGRTVENAFLSWIGTESLKRGASKLLALYRQTPKNAQFGEFYKSRGMFLDKEHTIDDTLRWYYNLAPNAHELQIPPWIKIEGI